MADVYGSGFVTVLSLSFFPLNVAKKQMDSYAFRVNVSIYLLNDLLSKNSDCLGPWRIVIHGGFVLVMTIGPFSSGDFLQP